MIDRRRRASQLLGVAPGASPAELRHAYRTLMRQHHPDVATDDPGATGFAAELASAYALLTGSDPEPTPASERPPPDEPPGATVRSDGVLVVEAPGNETFLRVLDALESIGDVTYRDRSGGYLQAMVQPVDGPLCTMVVAIEPRAVDSLVLFSLDSMDSSDAPPIEPILAELARLIEAG